MSKIRIYSKKAFAIGPGAQQGNPVIDSFVTVPMAFQDMPEQYVNDPTFKAAVKAGDITVIEHKAVVPVAPVTTTGTSPVEAASNATDPVSEYYEKVKGMNKEEVKAECEKYNAEFVESDKLKDNKKRLMEAFKLSISEDEDEDEE